MAPNLWGSLLLTAVLAVPAVASAQRPVDVGTMRARAETAQKTAGDSGKTSQTGAAAAKPAGNAATKPAGKASAKPAAKAAGTAASKPATDAGAQPTADLAAAKPTAPAVKPASPKPASPKPAAPAGAAEDAAKVDSLNDPTEAQVLRENFTYGGGTRDPFASLIKSANAGPEISDLQLVGIYEDMHYSGNSVAVLREKNSGKRHKLRAGDDLGRLHVQQVRSKEVVFTISDFGYQRQETLSLRKQEDVTP